MKPVILASMTFCLAVFLAAQVSLAVSGEIELTYDKQQDRLSIQAHQASLTQVLVRIAAETGMEIRTHPDMDQIITLQLPPQPLERALKQLVRGLSYILEYRALPGPDKAPQSRVVSMWLLPKGQHSSEQWLEIVNQGAGEAGGASLTPADAPTPGTALGSALPTPVPPATTKYFSPNSPDGIEAAGAMWQTKPRSTQVKPAPTKAQQPVIPNTNITGVPAGGGVTGDAP